MGLIDERWSELEQALTEGVAFDREDPFEGLSESERIELTHRLERFADEWIISGPPPHSTPVTAKNDPQLERVRRSVQGDSGMWPSMLPRLRERASLGRDELAAQLAQELGQSSDPEKVRRYYHRMEWGQLPGNGVSAVVLESLARLLDTDPNELRASGTLTGRRDRGSEQRSRTSQTFARFIGNDVTPEPSKAVIDLPEEPEWDGTDRLFLGG